MSTYNIGFYEDLTKIIFQLSSSMYLISSFENVTKLNTCTEINGETCSIQSLDFATECLFLKC